ncbi:MAG: PaaI family thioesterase [Oscillospiraceae bacterium]|nr:PaaI family thioesterase [Oscillospiraceae bacterium]
MIKEDMYERVNNLSGFNRHNGIRAKLISPELCVVEAELSDTTNNPLGYAHGGMIYSVCDVAAGILVRAAGCLSVTLSGNINYLRPTLGKSLRAEARIIKSGKTVFLVETNVYNDEDVHTARGEFQFYVLEDYRKAAVNQH